MSKSKAIIFVAVFLVAGLLSTVAFIVLKTLDLIGPQALVILVVGSVAVCTIFITVTSKTNKLL